MHKFYWVMFALYLGFGQTTTIAAEPATAAEAKMQVERLKQDIAHEEKTWSEEVTHEKEAENKRRQRFTEFNQDKQHLQQAIAEQENKLKALLGKMESHQFKEKELQARFSQFNRVINAQALELRKVMSLGLPYQMDKRTSSLNLLSRDLQSENISPEEGMNRLWAVYQNERRIAQDAEVYSGDFNNEGGDPIQVKYLRIGRQILAFSSLDGMQLGILRNPRAEQYVWMREREMDFATRQALKQAIATAEGKSVPGFAPFPIWKNTFAFNHSSDSLNLSMGKK